MTFRYTVREPEYTSMLEQVLKRNETKPFRLAVFFLLTAGQVLWVAHLVFFTDTLDHRGRIFVSVWSLFLAAINILYRLTRRRRAESTLRRLKSSGQILPAFWKEHSLRIDGNQVCLTFGDTCLECLCTEITVQDSRDYLTLYAHGTILDLVPYPAGDRRTALLDTLAAGAGATEKAAEDTAPMLEFPLTGKDILRAQERVYRKYYLEKTVSQPMTIAKFAASALLIFYAVTQFGWSIYGAVAVFVCLLWNLPLIMCLPPLTGQYLLSKVSSLRAAASEEVLPLALYLADSRLYVFFGSVQWSMDLSKTEMLDNEKSGIFLYTGTWPALFVPASAFPSPEAQSKLYNTLRRAGS